MRSKTRNQLLKRGHITRKLIFTDLKIQFKVKWVSQALLASTICLFFCSAFKWIIDFRSISYTKIKRINQNRNRNNCHWDGISTFFFFCSHKKYWIQLHYIVDQITVKYHVILFASTRFWFFQIDSKFQRFFKSTNWMWNSK